MFSADRENKSKRVDLFPVFFKEEGILENTKVDPDWSCPIILTPDTFRLNTALGSTLAHCSYCSV
jgi:hypothetical protein